jgi:hypothetical protein
VGGYDGDRGYADDRWNGDDDWRRGGYRDDDRGRGGYAPPVDMNAGYGNEPNRFGPPPQAYEPGYGPGPGPGPGPGSPAGGPGFGPRPPERGLPPMMEPPPTQVAPAIPQPDPRSRSAERGADSGVYRSRKPLHAVGIGVSIGIFELIMFLVFVGGAFKLEVDRVVAGGLMMMGLPLFGLGFYALITGAAHGGPRAFLKTPLAYLPIGLILLIAAGAAA